LRRWPILLLKDGGRSQVDKEVKDVRQLHEKRHPAQLQEEAERDVLHPAEAEAQEEKVDRQEEDLVKVDVPVLVEMVAVDVPEEEDVAV
jgi:hypothetical protein